MVEEKLESRWEQLEEQKSNSLWGDRHIVFIPLTEDDLVPHHSVPGWKELNPNECIGKGAKDATLDINEAIDTVQNSDEYCGLMTICRGTGYAEFTLDNGDPERFADGVLFNAKLVEYKICDLAGWEPNEIEVPEILKEKDDRDR